MIPICFLAVALIYSGASRYVYGYMYDPNIVHSFSIDLKLIPSNISNIVVSNNELAFYRVIAGHNKQITVDTVPFGNSFIATHDAYKKFSGYKIDKIITSSAANEADRFYLFKKVTD
jgi:hypothetical protein